MFILHSISEYYKKRYKTFFLGGGDLVENDTLLSFKSFTQKIYLTLKLV